MEPQILPLAKTQYLDKLRPFLDTISKLPIERTPSWPIPYDYQLLLNSIPPRDELSTFGKLTLLQTLCERIEELPPVRLSGKVSNFRVLQAWGDTNATRDYWSIVQEISISKDVQSQPFKVAKFLSTAIFSNPTIFDQIRNLAFSHCGEFGRTILHNKTTGFTRNDLRFANRYLSMALSLLEPGRFRSGTPECIDSVFYALLEGVCFNSPGAPQTSQSIWHEKSLRKKLAQIREKAEADFEKYSKLDRRRIGICPERLLSASLGGIHGMDLMRYCQTENPLMLKLLTENNIPEYQPSSVVLAIKRLAHSVAAELAKIIFEENELKKLGNWAIPLREASSFPDILMLYHSLDQNPTSIRVLQISELLTNFLKSDRKSNPIAWEASRCFLYDASVEQALIWAICQRKTPEHQPEALIKVKRDGNVSKNLTAAIDLLYKGVKPQNVIALFNSAPDYEEPARVARLFQLTSSPDSIKIFNDALDTLRRQECSLNEIEKIVRDIIKSNVSLKRAS